MANKYTRNKLGKRTASKVKIDLDGTDFAGGHTIVDLECDLTELTPNEGALPVSAVATICGGKYIFDDADENVDTLDATAIYTDGHAPSDVWAQLRAKKGAEVGLRYWLKGDSAGNRYHSVAGILTLVSPPGIPKSGGVFYSLQIAGPFDHGTS